MDLTKFNSENLFEAGLSFFKQLSVPLKLMTKEKVSAESILKNHFKPLPVFKSIVETYFLGTIEESVFETTSNEEKTEQSFDEFIEEVDEKYKIIMIFALKLENYAPTRTEIASLVRAFNRASKEAPVILLLKYENGDSSFLTFSTIERTAYTQKWREGEKLGKVSMLKDINIEKPHAGHLKILQDLKLKSDVKCFEALYKQWKEVFDIQLLNKQFYKEIANWYFWAKSVVKFPTIAGTEEKTQADASLIRLLTRIIFIWFLKEKKLVPDELFNKNSLDTILDYKDETGSTYYKAILQNLFFATLNTAMKKDKPKSRIFIEDAKKYGYINDGYLQSGYYRYKRFIKKPDTLLKLFANIPFLNGGLFECLDSKIDGKEIRIDCFSDNKKNESLLKVPDELFFSQEKDNDLNKDYGTKNKIYKVCGLINILNRYKFTIDENTPLEEDIALDPELLGRVFENLLANYNPETGDTARKATGSFYTPREIVNYMADESLIAYLEEKFEKNKESTDHPSNRERLKKLLTYAEDEPDFNENEVQTIIDAIDKIKILDPACGSGAFPMGILHKLVHILHKLDPENERWKKKLIEKTPYEIRTETEKALEGKPLDYIRKLGLIESCIYGVDIQPIAIQIAKLRFFISLIVEQKIDDSKENRDIRPLPNLETKFVAANTLIGLEQDDSLKSEYVEKAEHNLFDIRRKIFYSNSSSVKKVLQKKEKEARENLKEALKQSGFNNQIAEKIASWDPFEQNSSANWFDPEFMFGLKNGFDIVIGNPPYGAKYPEKYKKYFKDNYESAKTKEIIENGQKVKLKGSLDTFSLFIDKSMQIINNNSFLTFIVPLAITSSDSMLSLHRIMFEKCETIKVSTYSDRPKKIFDNAEQAVSILSFQKNNKQNTNLFTTKVNKKYSDTSISTVLEKLKFINSKDFVLPGRIPKIGLPIELKILEKIFTIKTTIKDLLVKENGNPIYYRAAGGRYFKVITNYTTNSSAEKYLIFDKNICNTIGAILSTNLYYWFYHIYSDTLNMKLYELEIMPIPVDKLVHQKDKIERLYDEYLKDLHKNSKIKKVNYSHISEYREYYARKSKHIIDQIDLAIQDAYGFTDEEINFIINYDIEFRLG